MTVNLIVLRRWWDKGESNWRSHTFHLIDNVELCSAERYEQIRSRTKSREQAACYFVWNEVIWKSFEDGYIKAIDMEMFRRIANGRRRDVPLRLYRWLDKQFWKQDVVKIDVGKLAIGTLGLQAKYPSEFQRIIERAARVLIDCKFMADVRFQDGTTHTGIDAIFIKKKLGISKSDKFTSQKTNRQKQESVEVVVEPDSHAIWISQQSEERLQEAETQALIQEFGSRLERQIIEEEKRAGKSILSSRRIRQEYIRRFLEPEQFDFQSLSIANQRLKVG